MTTRWTDNPRLLPFWLRGDEAGLPALAGVDPDSLAAFGHACADRNLAEERRLAYVAVTRAAYWLACTGYWWGAGKSPLGPSPFLQEVADSCRDGAGVVAAWADVPEDGAENPALAEPLTAFWPEPPGGARDDAIREAGDMVTAAAAAMAAGATAGVVAGTVAQSGSAAGHDAAGVPGGAAGAARYADLVAGWAADADLLLAQRLR